MKISVLPETLANHIAAGEVVERPASVVKELLENALDAGAKEISVWLENSGASFIRVSDDGEGIAIEDLPLALERHSTSKIREQEDLFHISTLGFRGEALPSIASVARLEIVSRPPGTPMGYRIRVEGGKREAPIAAACAEGTTVEIRDLFFNTPARRKFLRSPATELSHVCDVVNRMALAFHSVHFRLYHGGRLLSDFTAARDHQDRIRQVLGMDISRSLIRFERSRGGIDVAGYLSAAPASFSNSRYLMTFVNCRFVRDRVLTHAILQGYETLLMKGRYPVAVIYLKVPLSDVDVNVHPAKYEVRFRRQASVHDAVVEAVRSGLKEEAKAPGVMRIDGGRTDSLGWGVQEIPLSYISPAARGESPVAGAVYRGLPGRGTSEEGAAGFFSSMNVLGQILGCYLICASARGLAVIDQHAAHERVAFEKMRRQLELGELEVQKLLIPQAVELAPGEVRLLEARLEMLARLGFTLEPFGPNAYVVTGIPALLPVSDYRGIIRQLISEIAEVDKSEQVRTELEERLATIACHSVIRANRKMDGEEIRALLRDLDEVDFATQCPHGRPVLLEFTEGQLEKMFKRV